VNVFVHKTEEILLIVIINLSAMKKPWKTLRGNTGDAFIWVALDKTTDSVDRFIANLVAGKLYIEVPSIPHLICTKVLHHTNHSTVVRFVNDGLKVLWPTRVHEEKVVILYSDAAAYMPKAATVLKVFYHKLIHFTGSWTAKYCQGG
jgi:hypothetical protein